MLSEIVGVSGQVHLSSYELCVLQIEYKQITKLFYKWFLYELHVKITIFCLGQVKWNVLRLISFWLFRYGCWRIACRAAGMLWPGWGKKPTVQILSRPLLYKWPQMTSGFADSLKWSAVSWTGSCCFIWCFSSFIRITSGVVCGRLALDTGVGGLPCGTGQLPGCQRCCLWKGRRPVDCMGHGSRSKVRRARGAWSGQLIPTFHLPVAFLLRGPWLSSGAWLSA